MRFFLFIMDVLVCIIMLKIMKLSNTHTIQIFLVYLINIILFGVVVFADIKNTNE